jgi:hypothetical protein
MASTHACLPDGAVVLPGVRFKTHGWRSWLTQFERARAYRSVGGEVEPHRSSARSFTRIRWAARRSIGRTMAEDRHRLHPDGARLGLPRGRNGLVRPPCRGMAAVVHEGGWFCIDAVKEVTAGYDRPQISTPDRGNQLASHTGTFARDAFAILVIGNRGCARYLKYSSAISTVS